MKKHFVEFYSPGTFLSEMTTKEIPSWDVELAIEMSRNIKERHGATPYGFKFTTTENDQIIAESGMHFLGGKVYTYDEIKKQKDKNNSTLLANMKNNNIDKIIINNNSWKFRGMFKDGDILLDINTEIDSNGNED